MPALSQCTVTVCGVFNGTSVGGAGVVMAKLRRLTDSVSVAIAPKAVTVIVWFFGSPPVVRRSVAVLAAPVGALGHAIPVQTVMETVAVMPLVVLACTVSVLGFVPAVPALYVTATNPLVLVTPQAPPGGGIQAAGPAVKEAMVAFV